MPRQSVQNLADKSARQVQLKEKTPVKVEEMGPWLDQYPNKSAAACLRVGFTYGFFIPFVFSSCPMFSRNLKSAVQYPQVVADKIAKEVALGVPQFDAGSMQCGQTLPPVGVGLGNEGMMSLVRASVAESTWNSYGKAWREWCVMAGENPEVLPPARLRELVVGFLLHLREKGVPYSSAVKKVSGISFHLRLRGMTDVTKIFLVQQALKGWRKQHVRRENRRPVSYELMGQLIGALGSVCTDPFEVSLFSAAFCLAFFGALRIGELVSVSKLRPGGLLHNDVVLSNGTVQMRIRRSKTDQGGLGSWVVLQPVQGHTCPLRIITEYLACRTEGQVFLSHIDGSPLTRFQFISVLRKCLAVVGVPPGDFGTHSFRIGAATEASRAGLSIGKVKQIGRWKSDCVNSYVRPELLI
ncbi:uncharacterized protein ACNLHF_008919 isoform 3-T3 [Anomaloglossus baeobatrachus]